LKVVFDTNVYISEALFDALAEVIVGAGRAEMFSVYISDFIVREIRNVLLNHFHTTRRFASLTERRALRFARLVPTRQRRFKEVLDQKDHPVLETAINAGADYLVTGDRHLLAVFSLPRGSNSSSSCLSQPASGDRGAVTLGAARPRYTLARIILDCDIHQLLCC